MSFGLKNIGATYQRSLQKIFDDILHKNVKCYLDVLVVKPAKRQNHPKDLHEIEIEQAKIDIIIALAEPRNKVGILAAIHIEPSG
ncbi:hypothetical protein LIER_18241 [Lithospermum erythrorhizon]|uniref:Uncharacterized protein n=1 Tax=Lithospermum erythrorhizon TaxID=34254 RepID=A0AAV3QHP7_LITER